MTKQPGDNAHSENPSDRGDEQHESAPEVSDRTPDALVRDDVETLAAERDAARDLALRAQAELENYRKRVAREREDERRYADLPIVRDLLPGLDNLQRALDAARHTDDLNAMLQGVEMVAQQIESILAQRGVLPIAAVGESFDPNKHQAIQQVPSTDVAPMTVIDEVERGYVLHDRVVRPSCVIVSVSPPESSSTD